MSSTSSHINLLGLGLCLLLLFHGVSSAANYGVALTKSLLYFEAQRSGNLSYYSNQRVQWRGNSGLRDGSDRHIDLVGGYYDAGDHVKFGFPMAFTITMLAWSVVDFEKELEWKHELQHALDAVRWGTDYLLKAHPQPNVLYGQVGDPDPDHQCWQRPEEMTTPRTSMWIDQHHPGSDLAGETAAALAAASIAFRKSDHQYSAKLLDHAKQLFKFGIDFPGNYSMSIESAAQFYPSSGDEDEMTWAASWLHRAIPGDTEYLKYLLRNFIPVGMSAVQTIFSWDNKFAGVQMNIARESLVGGLTEGQNSTATIEFINPFEEFICDCLQKGAVSTLNIKMTAGGLLWFQPWNNLQYTTATTLIIATYSKYLRTANANLPCANDVTLTPDDLLNFVKSQVDYILGSNPKKMSYMVGMGTDYPKQIHHRGASIVSIKKDPTLVTCKGGFAAWYEKDAPDPNVLNGAVVGGPDLHDEYRDDRTNFQQAEPATVTTAPLVGVLALLAYN